MENRVTDRQYKAAGDRPRLAPPGLSEPGPQGTTRGMLTVLLAQASDTAQTVIQTQEPLWRTLVNNSLALVILFIFLSSIVTVIVRQRRRDKCLRLMHDYHVSYTDTAGRVVFGDLIVYSQGLELVFDAPYKTRRGVVKTSELIYEKDVANCLAVCRSVGALSAEEKKHRWAQIERSFRPGLWRRGTRSLRNLVNTLRDAFSKAISMVIGQVSKRFAGPNLAGQQPAVDQIGQTLLGAAANAYEPILERHIGQPVVLQLACPGTPDPVVIELPGYLVDYTEKYIAVFNVEHEPISDETLDLTGSAERPGYTVDIRDGRATITCTGPELLVVKSIRTRSRYAEPQAALVRGSSIDFGLDGGDSITLRLELTRRADVICPRTRAAVLFGGAVGSGSAARPGGTGGREYGIAPEPAVKGTGGDPGD
jgi:hypothetical protein